MTSSDEKRLRHRLGWWIAGTVAVRHAIGLWQLRRTLARADQPGSISVEDCVAEGFVVHIVVPVLREQRHIGEAVEWFASLLRRLPGSTLTFVTTAREERERDLLVDRLAARSGAAITARRFPQLAPEEIAELERARRHSPQGHLSRDDAKRILERSPLTSQVLTGELTQAGISALPIRHVHYHGGGRKAAQVNYAVDQLPETGETTYVAIYDVDSQPELELLLRTAIFVAERTRSDGEPPAVIQQPARFTIAGTSTHGWERALCRGAARLQTLWTLRREIPSFHRYAQAVRQPTGMAVVDSSARGLAQTVGHGLLVRLDVFRRLGGLPTFTVLDDLPFGYRLTVEGIPVDCLPFTGRAAAPETLHDLLAQGRRWFHNYLDYPGCAASARAEEQGTAVGRVLALGVGGYRGAGWLLRSPLTVACIVLAARRYTPWPIRVMVVGGLWLGLVEPVRLLAAADGRSPSIREHGQESLELLAAYLISSAGPAAAVLRRVISRSADIALAPKTNRRPSMRTARSRDDHRD